MDQVREEKSVVISISKHCYCRGHKILSVLRMLWKQKLVKSLLAIGV